MKEKSKKFLTILGIVFSLILIGTCIFFIYDSVNQTSNNQNNKKDNQQKEEINVDDIAVTLISKFNYG